MMARHIGVVLIVACSSFLASCGDSYSPGVPTPTRSEPGYTSSYGTVDFSSIRFSDDVESNAQVTEDLTNLTFIDASGQDVHLKDYLGEKHLVLVMTRGYSNSVCVFCSTQTSRLVSRYQELTDLNAELVVAFPVTSSEDNDKLDEFIEQTLVKLDEPATKVPFPLVLDVQLGVVDQLGIREALSKPATYILDSTGQVRFAYVGRDVSDRPSIDAIIEQLKMLNDEKSAG